MGPSVSEGTTSPTSHRRRSKRPATASSLEACGRGAPEWIVDLLRGSGRASPEAFAVHLGSPRLEEARSTRHRAASLCDGDRCRRSEVCDRQRRRLRPNSTTTCSCFVDASTDRFVADVLADALGLTGRHRSEVDEVRQILERRRESDLIALDGASTPG